jgi:hypothetical protein
MRMGELSTKGEKAKKCDEKREKKKQRKVCDGRTKRFGHDMIWTKKKKSNENVPRNLGTVRGRGAKYNAKNYNEK